MIIQSDYLMGRDKHYPDELTVEVTDNIAELLGRVNLLLSWAYKDGVRPALDKVTGTHIASGWRPIAINDATANAASHSKHTTGQGIDLRDNGTRDLAQWCLDNAEDLAEVGIWMERPQWTPTWVHWQTVPPGSRRRFYVPSTKPPLAPPLRGEDMAP